MSKLIDAREELEQTAAMLEQILEVMPEDLTTLRALYETSLKLELPERALESLTRLDDLARSTQNSEMIDFVLNQYAAIAEDSAEIQGRINRLHEVQNMISPVADTRAAAPGAGGDLEAEMALAWDLFQDDQLVQEEYSTVLHDLTEMSSNKMGVPVTVLHILHDRQFSRFERLMTHLCQKSNVPIIDLSRFEEDEELSRLLPLDFISRHGALPFSEVGGDLLLAVLNPFDLGVIQRAEGLSGRRCHPYLVTPSDYDQRLGKIKAAAA
ncbi:MAG: hypothetical protein JEZ10_08700 [Verrucomicrobia bacterium]|nr:hypothetical protein [Verrucomicrobiota bacterium]